MTTITVMLTLIPRVYTTDRHTPHIYRAINNLTSFKVVS